VLLKGSGRHIAEALGAPQPVQARIYLGYNIPCIHGRRRGISASCE